MVYLKAVVQRAAHCTPCLKLINNAFRKEDLHGRHSKLDHMATFSAKSDHRMESRERRQRSTDVHNRRHSQTECVSKLATMHEKVTCKLQVLYRHTHSDTVTHKDQSDKETREEQERKKNWNLHLKHSQFPYKHIGRESFDIRAESSTETHSHVQALCKAVTIKYWHAVFTRGNIPWPCTLMYTHTTWYRRVMSNNHNSSVQFSRRQ